MATRLIVLAPHEPCPCGRTNKRFRHCCFSDGRYQQPTIGNIATTGANRHRRCYASELGGCSTRLSLEHYVSQAVLELLVDSSGYVVCAGPSFARRVPAQLFGSRMLCTAHNQSLSPLDAQGARFFSAIHHVGTRFRSGLQGNTVVGVNGHDIERWLLKILIGFASSVLPQTKKVWRPPISWLRILYGQDEIPAGCGLSFDMVSGEPME
jgi:hypothetical protein